MDVVNNEARKIDHFLPFPCQYSSHAEVSQSLVPFDATLAHACQANNAVMKSMLPYL